MPKGSMVPIPLDAPVTMATLLSKRFCARFNTVVFSSGLGAAAVHRLLDVPNLRMGDYRPNQAIRSRMSQYRAPPGSSRRSRRGGALL